MFRNDWKDHTVKIEAFSEKDLKEIESIHLSNNNYIVVKRILDIILFLVLLLPTLLLILIFGLLIKMDSPGPVFFKHERVGKDLSLFNTIKLRSMYIDSGKRLEFTEEGDPRITRVGKVIRRFRIDELPQIFNVLIGQMSFIGPRPLAPYEYNQSHPIFEHRTIVKPGITGLAQVEGGNDFTNLEKFKYDMEYIKNFGFKSDMKLFFKTIAVIFSGKGSR